MREILFKAKRIDNGEWVEGYLLRDDVTGQYFIHASGNSVNESDKVNEEGCLHFVAFEIDKDTICQYTGLTDKNGNKIWENDVLKIARASDSIGEYYYPPLDYPVNVVVKWDLCAWMWESIEKRKHYISFPDAWCHYEAEVIGNIFDNPELLKGSEENEID